jgi:Mg2+ and Co2+ transporter CorA
MSIVDELEDKVDQVRQRLDSAVEELRSFSELKSALQETGSTLAETGATLSELAGAVEACVIKLNGAASGLADVVAAFKSSELVGTVAALARVETQVGELPASLAAVVEKRASAQTASISGVLESTKGSILNELASVTQNAQKLTASAKRLHWAMLALISINCAISLWAGLR